MTDPLSEFDWEAWDRQIERGFFDGKLNAIVNEALLEHARGRTKPLFDFKAPPRADG